MSNAIYCKHHGVRISEPHYTSRLMLYPDSVEYYGDIFKDAAIEMVDRASKIFEHNDCGLTIVNEKGEEVFPENMAEKWESKADREGET